MVEGNHWDQWFFNGFGRRQELVTMVFDGCAPLVRRWNTMGYCYIVSYFYDVYNVLFVHFFLHFCVLFNPCVSEIVISP